MTNTYSWEITQMECYPEHEGKADVVFNVGWSRVATDGVHTVTVGGSQAVTLDPNVTYIPYAELTEDDVIGWLEDAMGAELLSAQEAALNKQIEDQINPPVVTPALPWVA